MAKILNFKKSERVNKRRPQVVQFKRRRSFLGRLFNLKKILVYILLVLIILSAYIFIKNAKLNENLVLRQTEYEGLNRLTKLQVDRVIEEYFNKSMIGLDLNSIENTISENFIEISNVKAEKIYPDKIIFKIEEKTAKLILVNFNGKFLIDREGEILKAECREDKQKFNSYDYLMARGFGNPDGDYIEDIVVSELGEDLKVEEFDFKQFPYEEKVKILEQLQLGKENEFNTEINNVWENIDLQLDLEVPVMKSWTEDCFRAADKMDEDLVNFLADAYSIFENELQYEIKDTKWDGEFRLFIILNDDTQIILSPSRTLDDQIEDLESVLFFSGKVIYDYKVVDLSSESILTQ